MFSTLKKLSQLDSRILDKMETRRMRFSSFYESTTEELELLIKERDQLKEKISLYIQFIAIAIAFMNGMLALIISLLPYFKK